MSQIGKVVLSVNPGLMFGCHCSSSRAAHPHRTPFKGSREEASCGPYAMASGVPRTILTHSQRVCRLYKTALKTTYNWCTDRASYRYQAVLLRARFDASRSEKDYRKLAAMVEEAEEELWRIQHPQPFVYKDDPDGIIQYRSAHPSDDVLDAWHPWEKAQFIDYFETRQKRKDDFIKYYENHIVKKFEKPVSNLEFPVRGPHV